MHKDDEYEIDLKGYRVLIGLTIEETEELFRLDAVLSSPPSYVDALVEETVRSSRRGVTTNLVFTDCATTPK